MKLAFDLILTCSVPFGLSSSLSRTLH
jgi:hypothetical protein